VVLKASILCSRLSHNGAPKRALDEGSGCRVHAGRAHLASGTTLEEDVDALAVTAGIALRGTPTCVVRVQGDVAQVLVGGARGLQILERLRVVLRRWCVVRLGCEFLGGQEFMGIIWRGDWPFAERELGAVAIALCVDAVGLSEC